jgi:Zn finger protein HypA/HybF involved in hydrogenase expression
VILLHDSAIAAGIMEAVKGYEGLKAVFVLVGRDSCLHPDMLARSFDLLKKGTAAERAELVVLPGPGSEVSVLSVEVDETV